VHDRFGLERLAELLDTAEIAVERFL